MPLLKFNDESFDDICERSLDMNKWTWAFVVLGSLLVGSAFGSLFPVHSSSPVSKALTEIESGLTAKKKESPHKIAHSKSSPQRHSMSGGGKIDPNKDRSPSNAETASSRTNDGLYASFDTDRMNGAIEALMNPGLVLDEEDSEIILESIPLIPFLDEYTRTAVISHLLEHPEEDVRQAAVESIRDQAHADLLIGSILDSSEDVRASAVHKMFVLENEDCGDPLFKDTLINLLSQEKDPAVVREALTYVDYYAADSEQLLQELAPLLSRDDLSNETRGLLDNLLSEYEISSDDLALAIGKSTALLNPESTNRTLEETSQELKYALDSLSKAYYD